MLPNTITIELNRWLFTSMVMVLGNHPKGPGFKTHLTTNLWPCFGLCSVVHPQFHSKFPALALNRPGTIVPIPPPFNEFVILSIIHKSFLLDRFIHLLIFIDFKLFVWQKLNITKYYMIINLWVHISRNLLVEDQQYCQFYSTKVHKIAHYSAPCFESCIKKNLVLIMFDPLCVLHDKEKWTLYG